MAINKAYLESGRTVESDECITPRYAVTPLVKYLKAKEFKTVWCPFDKEDSAYVRVLRAAGFDVLCTHKDVEDGDFFEISDIALQSFKIDCIVSNPPFSLKDKVLSTLYGLHTPFCMLLPQNSLQSVKRTKLFMENGLEYLGFDKRICFYTNGDMSAWKAGNHFASGYFCHGVLPSPLIFEELNPIQEPYLTK